MKSVIGLLLLSVVGTAFAAELSYDEAKAKADQDEASLNAEQRQSLIVAQGKTLNEAHSACFAHHPNPDLSPYTVVMELDATGKVVRTWRKGETPLAICVHGEMSRKTLSIPPRSPFYTSAELTWHD